MDRRKARGYLLAAAGMAFLLGCVVGALLLLEHYLLEAEPAGGVLKKPTETEETGHLCKSREAGTERGDDGSSCGGSGTEEREALEGTGDRLQSVPNESIRVCILGNNYREACHRDVAVRAAGGITVQVGDAEELASDRDNAVPPGAAGGIAAVLAGSALPETENVGQYWEASSAGLPVGGCCVLMAQDGGCLTIENLARAQGAPEYAGKLLICREVEGYRVVNELPLEEYLAGVVSSEMRSDYPEEALKAQAVAARSYAVHCMRNSQARTPEGKSEELLSDLDDSASFQVYNNQKETEAARKAVEATAGEILGTGEARYYSTSCGTAGREDLDAEGAFRAFLQEEPEAEEEYGSPWLRWYAAVPKETVREIAASEYGFQGAEAECLEVSAREGNGRASKLLVSGDGQSVQITGEYAIRKVLSLESGLVALRDGTEMKEMSLLPSAFFSVGDFLEGQQGAETEGIPPGEAPWEESGSGWSILKSWLGGREEEYFLLYGGGYGHGEGMSQYGAAAMAAAGADYREILNYYYR